MTAPQTAWAKPLANQLVSLFRETELWIVLSTGHTGYDPATGVVGALPSVIFHCGGAVVKKLQGPHFTPSDTGWVDGQELTVWLDYYTCPREPNTTDWIWYQGGRWNIRQVDPMLESGPDFYGWKCMAVGYSGAAPGTPDPGPLTDPAFLPSVTVPHPFVPQVIETFTWTADTNGIKPPGGGALKWQQQPQLAGALTVGVPAGVTGGSTTGGTAPVAIAYQWDLGTVAGAGITWAAIPGANAATYTPLAAQAGQKLRVQVTATDAATPVHTLVGTTAALTVGVPALTRATLPGYGAGPQWEATHTITATPGTAAGGIAPITYTSHWERSADGLTGWATVPGVAAHPEQLALTAAEVGAHFRYVTVARDGVGQLLEIDGAPSPSVAAHTAAPLTITTPPVVTGNAVQGGTLTHSAAVITSAAPGAAGTVAITYRWQSAPAALGPWTDVTGQTGTTYSPAASVVGRWLRVVADGVDGDTPPARIQAPSAAVGPVVGPLARTAVPVLPAGVPQDGVLFGPATAGTFAGGLAPITITHQWQVGTAGTGGAITWANITGETGLSITPSATTAGPGKLLRLVDTATDSLTPTAGTATAESLPSAAVLRGTSVCAAGETVIRGSVYCAAGPWTHGTAIYDSATGNNGDGWQFGTTTGGTGRVVMNLANEQPLSPDTPLTYSPPMGDPADWRQAPADTWHNLRTGYAAEGLPSNPGTTGVVVAPSPAAAITQLLPPVPDTTGPWRMLPPPPGGGVPTWLHGTSGAGVQQWGDPAVIGLAGAAVTVWLGAGADPWVRTAGTTNQWDCTATGQHWPDPIAGGGDGPAGQRPQPADTATIPRPVASIPSLTAGTPGPAGFNPWVQLPRTTPISWWNYITRQEVHQPVQPAYSDWVSINRGTQWIRQADGVVFTQLRRPDLPADTAADWWESPAGTWHSTLRPEIIGPQTGNPGTVGNSVAITAATPVHTAANWTLIAGTGATAVWRSTVAPVEMVTQPGNPGIAGRIGPSVAMLRSTAPPSVTGTVAVGQVLTAHTGTTTGGTAPVATTYQWQEGQAATNTWVDIAGATAGAYTLTAAGVNDQFRVKQTWTDAGTGVLAQTVSATSAPTVALPAVAPPLTAGAVPAPTGTPKVGQVITFAIGTATGGTGTITHSAVLQAQAGGAGAWVTLAGPITTGTSTYTLLAGDVGKVLRVVDTITDSATPTPATITDTSSTLGPVYAVLAIGTAPTGITAGQAAAVGAVLTCTPGTAVGGLAPITGPSYRWQQQTGTAGWVDIPGATAATFTLTAAQKGATVRCTVDWADSTTPTPDRVSGSTPATAAVTMPAPHDVRVAGVVYASDQDWDLVPVFPAPGGFSEWGAMQVNWRNRLTGEVVTQALSPKSPLHPQAQSVDFKLHTPVTATSGPYMCGMQGGLTPNPPGTANWVKVSDWTDPRLADAVFGGINPFTTGNVYASTAPGAATTGQHPSDFLAGVVSAWILATPAGTDAASGVSWPAGNLIVIQASPPYRAC